MEIEIGSVDSPVKEINSLDNTNEPNSPSTLPDKLLHCCISTDTALWQQVGRGMKDDLQRRWVWYADDWSLQHLWSSKIWASALFILCSSLAPAVTFAVYFSQHTDNALGAIEVLFSMGLCGVLFAVLSGQPLTIVGVTGPVTILTAAIFTVAKALDEPFLPFYACSQLWAAGMHFLLALFNACDIITWVTRFSCESFGILISLIYLYTGLHDIISNLVESQKGNSDEYVAGLLQFILAMSTVIGGMVLSTATSWRGFLTPGIRSLIADYGPSVAVVICSAAAYLHRRDADDLPRLYLPTQFEPTTSIDRVNGGWLVDISAGLSTKGVFAAIFPGFVITVLFFFDHNVSSLIAQDPSLYHLTKGRSFFHWDIFVLGLSLIVTGVMGLPPCNGLIPQAPLHTRSLIVDTNTKRVQEQRWTALFQSIGCGLGAVYPFSYMLGLVPIAVLDGVFLYLGLQTWREHEGNQFVLRFKRMFMCETLIDGETADRRLAFDSVSPKKVLVFTVIQAVLIGIIFGVTFTPATVIFPVLIGLLVVVRKYGLPLWFSEDTELNNVLDGQLIGTDGIDDASLIPCPTSEEVVGTELSAAPTVSDQDQAVTRDESC
jgi:hypothetical protein